MAKTGAKPENKSNKNSEMASSKIMESSDTSELNLDALPESLTEEELDQLLIQSGVIDKLLSQLEQAPRSPNWETELDEL